MRYTPVELRHVRIDKSFFGGYDQSETDRLLEDVADSFEEVWRERGELADKLEDVEKILSEVKQRESLLSATLVAAEKTAAQAIETAKKEAEVIVAEAHTEARSITRSAQMERERLFAEARRVETLLRAALGMVEETRQGEPEAAIAPAAPEQWPVREDTREFKAVVPEDPPQLPPVQALAEDADDDGPWAGRDFAWG
jgi:cell division initiation protein